jgi:signal peptidase I
MDAIQVNEEILLYSTAGGSMFPLIRWKEHLIVKKMTAETLQPDDIIVFQEDGEHPVCHRIVMIQNQNGKRCFFTKGDRNRDGDMPVLEQAIIGKVIAVKKKYGLLEYVSSEWSSSASRHHNFLACSTFYLKNFLKKILTSISPDR